MVKVKPLAPEPWPESEPSPPASGRLSRLIRALFRPWLLACLAVTIMLAVFGQLLRNVLPDVGQRPEYQFRLAEMQVTPPPHYVPHDFIEQVIARADLPETVSLLERDITRRLADALRRHPWVERVERVTKSPSAGLTAELVYRRPAAMVQVKHGFYPVDSQGVLLPPSEFSVAEARRYPVIDGVQSIPQGQAGEAWGDPVVAGAAGLAALLSPHWKEFNLAAIEAPRRTKADADSEDGIYHLLTTGGSRIVWGRGPGKGHPGELTPAQKIGRMEEYAARFNGFDKPDGPYEIDIRHWQEISRVKLATAPGRTPRR